MRVGVFIPETSRMIMDLVVKHLASQPDMDVVVLSTNPALDGRLPVESRSCSVLVFAPSEDGPRGIDDLCACAGQSCLELQENGRAVVSWTISADQRRIGLVSPESLVDAVRQASARTRPI